MNPGDRFYRRKLPHWEKENASYFITFRVAGSLPKHLAAQADFEIESIAQRLKAQNRPVTDYEMERLSICEKYLDQDHTNPMLKDPTLASMVRDAILFHHREKYDLIAWCIMPNHVHLLLTPFSPATEGGVPVPLSEILHSIKSYTANRANNLGLIHGRLWQREYFDRWVRNGEELERYEQYIHQNPLLAGLVLHPEDYPWQGGTPPSLAVQETTTATEGGVPKLL